MWRGPEAARNPSSRKDGSGVAQLIPGRRSSFLSPIMIDTLSQTRALFDCIKPMEFFATIRLTRQEMERAALDLGAQFQTIRQWRYRNIPTRWQLKLIKHFGAMIVIDDVASADLPPVKQKTLADICREKFLTPSGLS